MVIYWDSSALVTLMTRGPNAARYRAILRESDIVTWWGSYVECAVTLARHAREGTAPAQMAESYRTLQELAENWLEVASNDKLRRAAARTARLHIIRAGDAFQLGAAMVACSDRPDSARFLTEDRRLKQAADREGFVVD